MTLVRDTAHRLTGIITDGDLRRQGPDVWHKIAGDVANYTPFTITPDTLVSVAIEQMQTRKITALVVADLTGELSGVVHVHDCLRVGAT
jgi:arabinose-5-phosphate isomerase